MTPYELADLSASSYSNATSMYAIFLTMVTAYLVTAYLVGARLGRIQVSILTMAFLTAMGISVFVVTAHVSAGTRLAMLAFPDASGDTFGPKSWLPAVVGYINIFTVAMCLKFMWDVRHPKKSVPH